MYLGSSIVSLVMTYFTPSTSSSGELSDSQLTMGWTRLNGSSFCGSMAAMYSVYCLGMIES